MTEIVVCLSNKSRSHDQRYLIENPGPLSLELRVSYSGSEQQEKCPLMDQLVGATYDAKFPLQLL